MGFLEFMYGSRAGRILLAPATSRTMSSFVGAFLDTSLSKPLIKPFVKRYDIDYSEFETDQIDSFNSFFTRKIRVGGRPIDLSPETLISPCDGLLSVHEITDGLVLPVKQSKFSIADLLRDEELAKRYDGGWCLVFRLRVNDYHRYIYVVDGIQEEAVTIPGVYHTVRPVAMKSHPVFLENTRTFTVVHTHASTVVQMEVGALLVGRIVNHCTTPGQVRRGVEKGYFEYGGSTIILLTEPGFCEPLSHLSGHFEQPIRMGQSVARIMVPRHNDFFETACSSEPPSPFNLQHR